MDSFADHKVTLNSPAESAAAITPNDTNDLASIPRAIYIGTSGDLAVIPKDGDAPVVFKSVAAGSILSVRAKRLMATGTTAGNLVALF